MIEVAKDEDRTRPIRRSGARQRGRLSAEHLFGQALRFGMVTGLSAAVTIGVPVLLREGFSLAPKYGAAIAFTCAFVLNFISLRRIIFRSSAGLGRDFKVFAFSSLLFRLLEYGVFLLLQSGFGINYVVALVAVLGISTVVKFFWYRRVMHRVR